MHTSKSLVYRTMRNKRRPPHRQCNCSGSAKKQFDTGDIAFDINTDTDTGGYSYGVNITHPNSTTLPMILREVLTIEPTTYKTITGKIKDILEEERFLDYFSSVVKVHTNDGEFDTILYMNNQQGTIGYLVMPNRYTFIALPITTLTNIRLSDTPNITFYIPLLIDILNNKVYDVTDELPDEITYMIDYYFKTLFDFSAFPKKEYRFTMLACQLLPFPDTRYGIMTASGYISLNHGYDYSGATSRGTVSESYNSPNNKLEGLSIGYTFYEK